MINTNKIDISNLLRKSTDLMLGRVLDLARISEMNDRAFQQFEKSIKQYFRETIDSTNIILKDYIDNNYDLEVSERPSNTTTTK